MPSSARQHQLIFENHRSRENTVVAKRRRKVAPFVSAGALLVVACGLAVGLAGSNPGHTLTGLLANRSGAIQTAECPQEIEARAGIECAMLNAFEHTDGSGAAIRLPFAILRSTASSPPPDPVLMIGGGPVSLNVGPSWHVVGAGQFENGNIRSDILWQHDSGQAAVWLMDGTTLLSGVAVASTPGADWDLIA